MDIEQRCCESTTRFTWIARLLVITALGCVLSHGAIASGQETADLPWLTGEAMRRQLETRVAVTWVAGDSFRHKINNLAHNLRVAVFLDRRIDPSHEMELSLPEMPLLSCLEAIAARLDAGVSLIGSVVYLGPLSVAARLATVAALREDEIARLPADANGRLSRAISWKWDELATPGELLAALAEEGGVTLNELDVIPHDLWAAGNLPTLTFAERMTLVLAGFDRTFAIDESARQLRLIPLPASPVLTRSYPLDRDPAAALPALQQAAPQAQVRRDGNRIVVSGRAEEHNSISRLLRGEKSRAPAAGQANAGQAKGQAKTVYSMRGPAALGTVLKTLQVRAELNVIVDPQVQPKLYERVTFEVRDASLDELVAAILKGTGLRYELSGRDLKILP